MALAIIERAMGNLSGTVKPVERREPRRVTGRVDVEKVIFPMQLEYLYKLENDKRIDGLYNLAKKLIKKWEIPEQLTDTRGALLASGDYIRLTERSSDVIFDAVGYCCDLLAINLEIEVYKGRFRGAFGATENASITLHSNTAASLTFDNDILNTLTNDNEIRYVIGHELGHLIVPRKNEKLDCIRFAMIDLEFLLNDPTITKKGYLELDKDINSMWELMRKNGKVLVFGDLLMSVYPKTEEITCDRFGLICCGNKEDAITASMKLHSGPDDPFSEYAPKDIIMQGVDLMTATSKNPELIKKGSPYYYADHPHPFLRALCIESFAKSETFNDLFSEKGVSGSKVNDECSAFFLTFNGLLPKKPRTKKEVQEKGLSPKKKLEEKKQGDDTLAVFEFICFLVIATADEKITPAEEKFYYKKFSRITLEQEDNISSLDDKAFNELFSDLAGEVSEMHGRTKTSLIKRLFGLIRADRKISDIELQVLMEIAKTIGSEKSCERILIEYYGYLPVEL